VHEIASSAIFTLDMATREQYEYKVILLGEAGVGKTSLFNRIKTGRFHDGQSTQGADRHTYTTQIGDDTINVSTTVVFVYFICFYCG